MISPPGTTHRASTHRGATNVILKTRKNQNRKAAGVPSSVVSRNRGGEGNRRNNAVVTRAAAPGNNGAPSSRGSDFVDDFFNQSLADFTSPGVPLRSFKELDESIDMLARRMEEGPQRGGAPPQTYRREERSEKQLPGGGYSKFYYSESVTTFGGAPNVAIVQPFSGGMLWASIAAGLVAGTYVTVVKRFLEGFKRTSYKLSSQLQLALMWPVLLVFGGAEFRGEFKRALKMTDGGGGGGGEIGGGDGDGDGDGVGKGQ
jgi:hypothetical protein